MNVRRALWLVVALGFTGCFTPRTKVTVPQCTDRVEIDGPHRRATSRTFLMSHGYDLPWTRTTVTVERADGQVDTETLWHTVPDPFRLVGGAVATVVGLSAVAIYAYRAGTGIDPWLSGTALLVPFGAGVGGVGVFLALTGWHQYSDIVIESDCAAAGPGQLRRE